MLRLDYAIAVGFVAVLATPLVVDVLAWNAGLELPGMRPTTEVAQIEPGDWLDGTATQKVEQTLVGGSLLAGPEGDGWRVEASLPVTAPHTTN